jgi:hypothetical protein
VIPFDDAEIAASAIRALAQTGAKR